MAELESNDYRKPDEYRQALNAFHGIAGMILFEFAKEVRGDRDLIV